MGGVIIEYAEKFRRLAYTRSTWITATKDWLEFAKKEIVEETGDFDLNLIRDIQVLENSVKFSFADLHVCIEFHICATKELGFVKWFLEDQQSETDKNRRALILRHKFNRDGVETHARENRRQYFNDSLSLFCEKVDQIEFNKIPI